MKRTHQKNKGTSTHTRHKYSRLVVGLYVCVCVCVCVCTYWHVSVCLCVCQLCVCVRAQMYTYTTIRTSTLWPSNKRALRFTKRALHSIKTTPHFGRTSRRLPTTETLRSVTKCACSRVCMSVSVYVRVYVRTCAWGWAPYFGCTFRRISSQHQWVAVCCSVLQWVTVCCSVYHLLLAPPKNRIPSPHARVRACVCV